MRRLFYKVFKKLFRVKVVVLTFAIAAGLLAYSNLQVRKCALQNTYHSISEVPYNNVGLVLGTAKTLKNGNTNLYFKYRVEATAELYRNGKITYVLVSGDNGRAEYDEPTDFKNALIARGIPAERIYLDYAGFRTLDSVVRAKKIFGQESLTFISQKFHNERAIYLAQANGIDAIGFNARDVSKRYGFKVKVREYFARTKAYLDVLLGVGPKFLGEKILIK